MMTPASNNGKYTKNNDTGNTFSLSGLRQSSHPASVDYPSHKELLQIVTDEATPFDFLEYHYRRDVAHDFNNNHISELRERAGSGDREAVQTLEKIARNIRQKDYKVYVIEHFIETFNTYRFCSYGGLVYAYNGAYWQQVEEKAFSKMLGAIASKYGVPGTTPRDEEFHAKLLKQFHEAADQPVPTAAPVVNLHNGTLRIDEQGNTVLGGFDWREFIRYQLPYDYDPEATAPRLQAFINEVVADVNQRNIILEYLGSCFAPSLKTDDKILLMYGQGANGKSVLCDVVTALFGALNVSHVGIDKLTQSGQPGEFAAVQLDGKLLNFATELDSKSVKSDLFKQLASREPIRAAYKHKDAFPMIPPKMVSNCNELPRTGARDWGFYRRLQIINFDVTIPPEKQNTNLAKELIETELPGFLNLVLSGLRRLIQNGGHYTANPKGDNSVKELWAESDSVTAFLEDCFNVEVEEQTEYRRGRLYEIFKQYCSENGRQALSNRQFFGLLRQRKFQEVKRDGRYFVFAHPLATEWYNRYNPFQ